MYTKDEQAEAIKYLRSQLKSGSTVYNIIRHVSSSGMTRYINCYVIKNNKPFMLDYWIARAIDWAYDKKHDAIKVEGCGMDMCFHLVNTLESVLFIRGGKLHNQIL